MWTLRERVTRLDAATIAVVLGGIALFFLDKLTMCEMAGNTLST